MTKDAQATGDSILGFSPSNTTTGLVGIVAGTLLVGVLAIVAYAAQSPNQAQFISVLSGGLIIGAASGFVGNILGFLFGIPRSPHPPPGTLPLMSHDGETAYKPNSNLEEMSDWLTKILVGVGLTQIATAPPALASLAATLAPALGGFPTSVTFAGALVVYSVTDGFMIAYIATRFYTPALFGRADVAGLRATFVKTRLHPESAPFKDAAELAHAAIVQRWTLEAVTQLLDDVAGGTKTFQEATQEVTKSAT